MAKKTKTKRGKKASSRKVTHELVVRVAPPEVPTTTDLMPVAEGGKYMIPKTWLSEKQVVRMVQMTPRKYVYKRKGRGGQVFDYVTGSYVTKVLNYIFGWNWDFEIVNHGKEGDLVWVLGKLTVKDDKGHTITKTQFGRAEIKFIKGTKQMVDFGNDLKAATTDALKKCASLLGIASDVYGKTEYKEETGMEVVQQPTQEKAPETKRVEKVVDAEFKDAILCESCDAIITPQEAEFSKKIYKKRLCRACQKVEKK